MKFDAASFIPKHGFHRMSNLNAQVQANDKILAQISSAVIHADEMVQGLKRHWLPRSAFKEKKTNPPPALVKPSPARPGRVP